MKNKEFTGFHDDNKTPIFVGDELNSEWGFKIIVIKDNDDYVGKLVCNNNHSCKDINYALNDGRGYVKKTYVEYAKNLIRTFAKNNKELINEIMKENKFPEFWYESNACWGYVRNMEDLREKFELQTDKDFGGLETKDDFLDRSKQNKFGGLDFGTRREHKGKKTLREFLVENNVDIDLL